MPTFNMTAQTPNGQPAGTEAVYTNGIPQSYAGRKFLMLLIFFVFKKLHYCCYFYFDFMANKNQYKLVKR